MNAALTSEAGGMVTPWFLTGSGEFACFAIVQTPVLIFSFLLNSDPSFRRCQYFGFLISLSEGIAKYTRRVSGGY